MPLIQSAKKKLRKDIKRTKLNREYVLLYKKAISQVKKHRKGEKIKNLVEKAYKAIDKAVKKKVIHKNKGSRLKSTVSRLARK